jgi:hypothetical protein
VQEGVSSAPRRVTFGVFELDLRSGELRKAGGRINLPDQPFRILAVLLEHPGELVTRDELRSRVWPTDTFVDFEHGLNAAIKRLRDALVAKQQRFTGLAFDPERWTLSRRLVKARWVWHLRECPPSGPRRSNATLFPDRAVHIVRRVLRGQAIFELIQTHPTPTLPCIIFTTTVGQL